MDAKEIESESRFIWKLIFHILITPFTLLLVIFGKKKFKDLFQPFTDIVKFVSQPKFSITIIIINVVLFFLSSFFSEGFFNSLLLYPQDIMGFRFLSLITAGFLHANWAHLTGNMIAIFIFGRVVEREIGHVKTALVYFGALIISGVFSSLIHIFLMGDNTPGLGASGALMGLIATAILMNPFYITRQLLFPLPIMVVGWLAVYADIIGILNPAEDGIGHLAHIGGLISVAIIGYMLGLEERQKMKKGLIINLLSLLAFGMYIFMVKGI
jgi:membrane associated rhomboid family serine protease